MKIPYSATRLTTWACFLGLAVASWTPGDEMIRTGLDPRLEHMLGYTITGVVGVIAYPRKALWSIAVLLSAYAGVLELGQRYIPGRHAQLLDWLASSGGVACACVTGAVFFRRRVSSARCTTPEG
jgi:VanZ family protein